MENPPSQELTPINKYYATSFKDYYDSRDTRVRVVEHRNDVVFITDTLAKWDDKLQTFDEGFEAIPVAPRAKERLRQLALHKFVNRLKELRPDIVTTLDKASEWWLYQHMAYNRPEIKNDSSNLKRPSAMPPGSHTYKAPRLDEGNS